MAVRKGWVFAVMCCVVAIATVGVAKFLVNRHVHQVEEASARASDRVKLDEAEQAAYQNGEASDSVAQPSSEMDSSGTSPDEISPAPKQQGTNCYDNEAFRQSPLESDVNSQTRDAFSQKVNADVPDNSVSIYTAGKDSQYLLFVASPENEPTLRQIADSTSNNSPARANFCLQGFAEVQFIIRDSDMHQTLLSKLPTSVKETIHYAMQRRFATPMQ